MLKRPAYIKPPIGAGLLWFGVMFALGFVLGTLRVLVTAPALGALVATLVELPMMLAAGWMSCLWASRRVRLGPAAGPRLLMAGVFFVALMAAEQALGIYGFGRSLAEQAAAMQSLPALLGLGAQLLTASFPLWQAQRRQGRRQGRRHGGGNK